MKKPRTVVVSFRVDTKERAWLKSRAMIGESVSECARRLLLEQRDTQERMAVKPSK